MKIDGKEYRTIWFENNIVKIIDQTKLPHQFAIKDLKTVKDAINAIKVMEVRGAPLIGATAAYGLVLAILENNDQSFLKKSAEDLIKSRPTAINLKWAVDRMINKLSGVNSEKILDIIDIEKPEGVVIQFGGQTPLKLADSLSENGVKILGDSNLLNKLPISASNLYSKNLLNFVINLYDKKNNKININLEDEIIKKTLVK